MMLGIEIVEVIGDTSNWVTEPLPSSPLLFAPQQVAGPLPAVTQV